MVDRKVHCIGLLNKPGVFSLTVDDNVAFVKDYGKYSYEEDQGSCSETERSDEVGTELSPALLGVKNHLQSALPQSHRESELAAVAVPALTWRALVVVLAVDVLLLPLLQTEGAVTLVGGLSEGETLDTVPHLPTHSVTCRVDLAELAAVLVARAVDGLTETAAAAAGPVTRAELAVVGRGAGRRVRGAVTRVPRPPGIAVAGPALAVPVTCAELLLHPGAGPVLALTQRPGHGASALGVGLADTQPADTLTSATADQTALVLTAEQSLQGGVTPALALPTKPAILALAVAAAALGAVVVTHLRLELRV